MVKVMLSNTYFPKEQTKISKTKMEKHHIILHVYMEDTHKEISFNNILNEE